MKPLIKIHKTLTTNTEIAIDNNDIEEFLREHFNVPNHGTIHFSHPVKIQIRWTETAELPGTIKLNEENQITHHQLHPITITHHHLASSGRSHKKFNKTA